ncbi:MAG: M23 family metallopeptidase [Betaproteobacteria bacterium]
MRAFSNKFSRAFAVFSFLQLAAMNAAYAATAFSWPLPVSGQTSTAANANGIRYGIGPRAVGGYDFHAGLDLLAANLTPVFAVSDGTVSGVNAGSGTEGNQVVVNHGAGRFTVYNHLSGSGFPKVAVGAVVSGGVTQIGNVGDTGAEAGNFHLHLTYVYAPGTNYSGANSNEKFARSPLEILPHTPTTAADINVAFAGAKVEITLPVAGTITRIVVAGNGVTRTLDYYGILGQGSVARNAVVQSGLGLSVTSPDAATNGRVKLTLDTAAGGVFTPNSVTLFDFLGNIVYPAAVPQGGISLQTSSNPVAYRQPVTLKAFVNGSNPGGTVNFSLENTDTVICKAVPVVASVADCPVPGARNIANVHYLAAYSGDGAISPSSATLNQLVSLDVVTLSAVALPQQPVTRLPLTLRAMITARNPGGKVTFFENGVAMASCASLSISPLAVTETVPVAPAADVGVATCTINEPVAGSHTFVISHIHGNDPGFDQIVLPVTVAASARTDYTDMWWAGLTENGWGASITQHGEIQFIAFYVYDDSGKPVFHVLPNGSWSADATTYTGNVYLPTSAQFLAYDAHSFKANDPVGTASVTYTSAATAQLNYTINGKTGKKSLVREIFAADDDKPKLQVGDLWWGGIEQNGWGVNIAQQGRMLFPVWYTYNASGNASWFAVPGGTWSGPTFIGDIYSTTSSPWLGVSYNPAAMVATKVGSMTLHFSDQSNAIMTYTVGGVTQSKVIARQPY